MQPEMPEFPEELRNYPMEEIVKRLFPQDPGELLSIVVFEIFNLIRSGLQVQSWIQMFHSLLYYRRLDLLRLQERQARLLEDYAKHLASKDNPLNEYDCESCEKALSCLSPEDRKIVELCYFQQRSYEEIAEITGLSKNAVGCRLSRARMQMFARLREEMP